VTQQQKPDGDFRQRLRAELKAIVAERAAAQAAPGSTTATPAWRRRAPRLALGGGVALTAVAGALIVSAGGNNTSKAFAVEPQDGGGVTIEVYSAEDAAGLEEALGEAGIRSQVTWLPAGMMCREPHFTPSTAKTSLGGTIGGFRVGGPGEAMKIGAMSAQQWSELVRKHSRGEISDEEIHNATATFSLDPTEFRPDQTVVVAGSPAPYGGDPEGGFEAEIAIAEGPVEPCQPVTADHPPMLGSPEGGGGGAHYAPSGDEATASGAAGQGSPRGG
jgi:hypothetical protein